MGRGIIQKIDEENPREVLEYVRERIKEMFKGKLNKKLNVRMGTHDDCVYNLGLYEVDEFLEKLLK